MPEIEALDVSTMHALAVRITDENSTRILREQWNAAMPFMAMGFLKSMDFEEYKSRTLGSTLDLRSNEEILAEVEGIRKQLKGE